MKTELEHASSVHKEIKIEIDAAEISTVYEQVIKRYTKMATVAGFRKGYAPRDVVKLRYREDIQNDVLRDLLPNRVTEAIQEHGLQPLSEPQLHIENVENLDITKNAPVNLRVHVEVMPEIETPNYKGLEAVRRVRPIAEDEIEKMIESRREEQAALVPVEDRTAEIGDTVNINIIGTFVDDAEAEPINVEGMDIELGGGVQDEFTENLTGTAPEDTRTFTIDYPADFSSPALAGKKLEFTATVNSIGRVELPELNDEFAQSLSEGDENYESLAQVREKLRQDFEVIVKLEADNRVREELISKMIDANPVEVPPTLVNYQAQGLAQQFAQNMEQQGIDMRQADQKLWEMLYQQVLPQAEREVRGALLLDRIGEIENIEVGEDEINSEIELIALHNQRTPDEVREMLKAQENGEHGLTDRLRNRKTIEILIDNASITDGEWQEPETEMPEIAAETLEVENTADEATAESEAASS